VANIDSAHGLRPYLRSRSSAMLKSKGSIRLLTARGTTSNDFSNIAKGITAKYNTIYVSAITLPKSSRSERIEALDKSSKGKTPNSKRWPHYNFYQSMMTKRTSQFVQVKINSKTLIQKPTNNTQPIMKKKAVFYKCEYLPAITTLKFALNNEDITYASNS
jgi:hypothetical protein